jgi:exopolyphosphatase/guanosine-5'-triphosphate,3'-diphosphate pyrophosphatase
LEALVERATITRLGKGVDRTRTLDPERVEATLDCLRSYATLIEQAHATRLDVVGTSAMRDARGGDDFCDRVATLLGVRPRVITGAEEARLTFQGALVELDAMGDVVVVDIGGGSTEIIVGNVGSGTTLSGAVSLDVGSVRLFERHLRHDPPTSGELQATREEVRAALRNAPQPGPSATLVGVAGTVTTLLAIELELFAYDPRRVHNQRLPVATLKRLEKRLGALSIAERRQLPGLEPARADVIVVGACILAELAAWAGADTILVSDRGVRWGLISALLPCPERDSSA